MNDLYFCPTAGEIESAGHGGFKNGVCCKHPWLHVPVEDSPAVQKISLYLSDMRREWYAEEKVGEIFRRRLTEYVRELEGRSDRISTVKVRQRLTLILAMSGTPDPSEHQDRVLNDPEGLWGSTPGWRCWVGRHAQCEPLGADEHCTCACGLGERGHGLEQNGVKTPGCDCGHEGMGITWHAQTCAWRESRRG